MISTYIVYNELELDRKELVKQLQEKLPHSQIIKSVYPREQRVPFFSKIQQISKDRTGKSLTEGEIGCLLSHRKVWRTILQNNNCKAQSHLIVESDAVLVDPKQLAESFQFIEKQYDLFFWGAFEGRVKLFRSTRIKLNQQFTIGIPLDKSLYCAYAYSINKQAAAYLLKATSRFGYPVDIWKIHLQDCTLKVGAVKPEIIKIASNVATNIQNPARKFIINWSLYLLVELKNRIIVLFK